MTDKGAATPIQTIEHLEYWYKRLINTDTTSHGRQQCRDEILVLVPALLVAMRKALEENARLRDEITTHLADEFLVARVSEDATTIGIVHGGHADWHTVLRAHVALRNRLNERITEQEKCPLRPLPPPPSDVKEEI